MASVWVCPKKESQISRCKSKSQAAVPQFSAEPAKLTNWFQEERRKKINVMHLQTPPPSNIADSKMSPDVLAQTCTHKYLAIISFKLCHLSQLDIVIPLSPFAQIKA